MYPGIRCVSSVGLRISLMIVGMFSHRTNWRLTSNRFTEAHREMRAVGRDVLDLTVSNPTRVGLHFDSQDLLTCLMDSRALDYDPHPKGMLSARKAVTEYYRERHEAVNPESLVLTTSTSEGYSYIFRLLCNPGDEILVPKPSYPLFEFLADLQDVKLVGYPLIYDHGWQIDFPSLYKAAGPQTKAVIVVHPNNPTGSYVSEQERSALNQFCREYEAAIVADEVFLDYALDGASRDTFAGNSDVLTFVLSGISKISALPQMKLAWIAANGPGESLTEASGRLEVIADTYLSMNAPIQLAASELLGQRKKIQPILLDRVRVNLEELDRELVKQSSCTRLAVDGGWYAILRVPVTRTDEELAIALLQESGVLVHPGHFYDFPSDGYLILSLITPTALFQEGVARLLKFINQ